MSSSGRTSARGAQLLGSAKWYIKNCLCNRCSSQKPSQSDRRSLTSLVVVADSRRHQTQEMPPVRSARNRKPPPDGFDDIEDTLLEFANKMKDAENASHEGKKRHEVLWPIFQISHQRSRYIYDLYYDKEAISKQLYEWLLKNGYADGNLIAKWKKQGYEKLCCLRCIQTKETNFNATCICRVPQAQLKEDQTIECVSCGCRGCSSAD